MRRALLSGVLALLAACTSEPTGIELTVRVPDGMELDRLRLSATSGGAPVFEPGMVPEEARPIVDGEVALLYLPDELGGVTMDLHVDGMAGTSVIGSAVTDVALETGVLLAVTVELDEGGDTEPDPDPGPDPEPGDCNNGVDDDGDGHIDDDDPGCDGPDDPTERGSDACDNAIDDDGDGLADYPADPGCEKPDDDDEHGDLACDDGDDNDDDGIIDLEDPGCNGPVDPSEKGSIRCDNGIDDDDDGLTDFHLDPAKRDPGCTGPDDNNEKGGGNHGGDDD